MDSGILPPGLLCTEGAWCSFRNSDKDQYEDEVKIYIFQRIPQAAETIRCLTLQTQMDLTALLTVRHLILRLPIRGENEGCIPCYTSNRQEGCLLLVCMLRNISALGVQTSINPLDKALAQALFVK